MSLETKSETEFGRGLTYCLGLFLAHAERYSCERCADFLPKERMAELWFSGASDHLYDLNTDSVKNAELKVRIKEFQLKCLKLRHGFPDIPATDEDKQWAIKEAKELLCLIDEKELGIETGVGRL